MSVIKKIAQVLLLVSLPVAVLEVSSWALLKLRHTYTDPDSDSWHVYDPYRGHRLNPGYFSEEHRAFLHSLDGFRRDTPVSVAKDSRTIRIIMLGGSALYGLGAGGAYPFHPALKNTETIPWFLEQRLRAQLRQDGLPYDVEVMNAGLVGYHTFQHLVYLNALLLDYRPDWVINFDGHNDFYFDDSSRSHWMDYGYSSIVLTELVNTRSFTIGLHLLVRSLTPYSYTMNLFERQTRKLLQQKTAALMQAKDRRRRTHKRTDRAPFAENYRNCATKSFMRALWQIYRLGDREGYRHCVILEPEIIFEDESLLTEHDRHILQATNRLAEQSGFNWPKKKAMRDLLPGFFEDQGIPFHDLGELAPHNPGRQDLYLDYCHLSPEGSRVAAEQIFRLLYPQIVKQLAE